MYQPRGLVLICGPTGLGKTTLMSAFYAHCSEHIGDAKILLYEDPIEFLYTKVRNNGPRIRQMQIGRHIPDFRSRRPQCHAMQADDHRNWGGP
ncbi:ATPase, T2SS/T4P/T4SS family [Cupriavidus basilensis]